MIQLLEQKPELSRTQNDWWGLLLPQTLLTSLIGRLWRVNTVPEASLKPLTSGVWAACRLHMRRETPQLLSRQGAICWRNPVHNGGVLHIVVELRTLVRLQIWTSRQCYARWDGFLMKQWQERANCRDMGGGILGEGKDIHFKLCALRKKMCKKRSKCCKWCWNTLLAYFSLH